MQSVFAERAFLSWGWRNNVRVGISAEGRIAAIEENAAPKGAQRVKVLLPAPGNLHSHTFQRAMAGLAERRGPEGRDSFWTWRSIMYRFLDILTPEDIEAVAALAFMEMQEAGFAGVAEFHYVHHQPGGTAYEDRGELSARIIAAANETGIGLTLLPVLYRYGGVDQRPLQGGQQRFGNDIDGFSALLEQAKAHMANAPADARLGVAPHSLRAASEADIKAALTLAPDAPFHMHIAEQVPEIEEVKAAYGQRPMEWLLDRFPVDERWCLIHCTHMTEDETKRLARSGAVAGLCPVTEANLGDGIFNGDLYLAEDGRLGVGSDSNIRISVGEELRQMEYSQRLRDRARCVLAEPGQWVGETLFSAASAGGAQALGRESGAIKSGLWADLVAIDPSCYAGGMKDQGMLDDWIFTGDSRAVTDLWSAGRHCVKNGAHENREPILARYSATIDRLTEQL